MPRLDEATMTSSSQQHMIMPISSPASGTVSNKEPSLMSQTFTTPSSEPMTKMAAVKQKSTCIFVCSIHPPHTREFWHANRGQSETTRISIEQRHQKFFRSNRPEEDLSAEERRLFQVCLFRLMTKQSNNNF